MIALKAVLQRLEWITTPPTSYTNDTKVFSPPADDTSPQAIFKRSLFSRSMTVLDAGKSKLQGQSVRLLPGIKEDDYENIVAILDNDPEQREFFELLHVASTAQLLIQDA
ncbi:TPA: hypothetical protein JD357_005796 [Citrobacter freundii]|uniref:Uncharacterized protein n=1 Tax=Citrobacter freundii TaxID=546 RepID=A0A7R7ECY6_CITFR|nr:hypothetical protein [Citrobacter freundii]BCM23514.1 hypothetical protein [Citrobacter freundii]BCM23518.1 hypothetical protein [Citrobacter freundii]BCM23552.1 hypothetical protein [Citrobacter freundii]HAZ3447050.1 hypothetical protein [Citrobacter freundii]